MFGKNFLFVGDQVSDNQFVSGAVCKPFIDKRVSIARDGEMLVALDDVRGCGISCQTMGIDGKAQDLGVSLRLSKDQFSPRIDCGL